MLLIATSSSRKECKWRVLCRPHPFHPQLSPQMEAMLGVESRPKPLSIMVRQQKLLEKMNLDGLAHWSPENAAAVRELLLVYHDVFTLESNKLGCTSAIEHELCIKNGKPFKEQFRCI